MEKTIFNEGGRGGRGVNYLHHCFMLFINCNYKMWKFTKMKKIKISRAEDIVTEDAKVRKSQPDKPIHR